MRDSASEWQKILAQGFSSTAELLNFLNLSSSFGSHLAEKQFKTRVPRAFAALMEKGNPKDPLLRQVLAVDEELHPHEHFSFDPLKEASANPVEGLIHKYHGRVLITFGACVIHCRYCFRRHFPYHNNNPARDHWSAVLNYIAQDDSIHEVILSGGDPLLNKDKVLHDLLSRLVKIPHIHTIRMHTRIPVVLPERIDENFLRLLSSIPLKKVVVLHGNHPREYDERVARACLALRHAGCHLLNQSVLLAGVNDNAHTLAALSERVFACGILPYYLHVLDKVQGTAHFDISVAEAKTIFQQLQSLLPGYLVPRLAKEEPGKPNKTLLF